MEGFPQVASKRLNLLAAAARLGGGLGLGSSVEELHFPTRLEGSLVLGAVLHGRKLHYGQKRRLSIGKSKKDKGAKWMVVMDGQCLPVANTLSSALPAEVTLVVHTLADYKEKGCRFPQRLITEGTYDADWLRNLISIRDGELICPQLRNLKRTSLQDGTPLRAPLEDRMANRALQRLFKRA